nr:hypothetical protein [uncultured archaeon]
MYNRVIYIDQSITVSTFPLSNFSFEIGIIPIPLSRKHAF